MARDMFSIGEFSRMTSLTVKALRLYDEEGILKPGFVDRDTGYRYYSSTQTHEAGTVRLLRSLEMPLDDIREYMRTVDARREILDRHRSRLEEKLSSYREIISSINGLAEGKGSEMERVVEMKEMADLPVIGVRFESSLAKIGDDIGTAFGKICGLMGRTGIPAMGPPFTIYYDMDMKDEGIDMELCMPVAAGTQGTDDVVAHVVDGCKAATTMHMGPYEQVHEAYAALLKWVKDNGYEVAGPDREVYLVGPDQVENAADLRTEVLIPIA